MDKLTSQEKEQALKEFELKQERQYSAGKTIVFVIAAVNIVGSVTSAVINFNLFQLIVQIALSIALFYGVSWVRYFFAIGAAINVFLMLFILTGGSMRPDLPVYFIIISAAYLVYSVICSIVLFVSKSVSWFLYSQKNG